MTEEQQIEEMACKNCIHYEVCMYVNAQAVEYARAENCKLFRDTADYRKDSELEEKLAEVTANWQKLHDAYDADCIEHYNKGRSEVASELVEEIEEGVKAAVSALQFENNPIHRTIKHETYSSIMRFIKTVEKKYRKKEK